MHKKNQILKRILQLLLTLSLIVPLVVLAGCGGTPEPTEIPTEEPTEEATEEETEAPTEEATEEETEEPTEEATTASDTLFTAYFEDLNTLDPDVWYDIEGGGVFRAVYDTLVRYVPGSTEIEPWLAKDWDLSEDGLTYTFYLEEGVTFHDGTPFNAEAVRFNFERRLAVDQGPAYMLADIEEMEVVDDYTFKVTLSEPVAPFLHFLACMWGPKMISPATIQENEVDGDWAQEWAINNAVGTGPFILEEYNRGEQITLTRNEDYWGGWDHEHVDQIIISIINETATQRLLLENGDLDILTHGLAFSDLDAFIADPNMTVEELPSNFVHIAHLNCAREPTDDPLVRQALSYAWPYAQFREAIGPTHFLPFETTYPRGFLGGDEPPLPYTFDLEKAQDLLMEAGYPDGGFTLEYVYVPNEREFWRQAGEIYQANLAQLGIQLDIKEVPISMVWDFFGDPEATPHFFTDNATPDGSDPYLWTSIVWESTGWLNWSIYENAEVDELINEGLHETDVEARADIYRQVGGIVAEDAPALFVGDGLDHFVYHPYVEGVIQYPAYPWTFDYYYIYKTE
jgi:peptide/nickel transport system substrate-binding protein